jgi:hypothetical protein
MRRKELSLQGWTLEWFTSVLVHHLIWLVFWKCGEGDEVMELFKDSGSIGWRRRKCYN